VPLFRAVAAASDVATRGSFGAPSFYSVTFLAKSSVAVAAGVVRCSYGSTDAGETFAQIDVRFGASRTI
jgi:hypothetical protein